MLDIPLTRDRRSMRRHLCGPDHGRTLIARLGNGEPVHGLVRDLSAEGIGLLASHEVPLDSLVAIALLNIARTVKVAAYVRVVRENSLPEGGCVIGAAFTETLSQDELDSLL